MPERRPEAKSYLSVGGKKITTLLLSPLGFFNKFLDIFQQKILLSNNDVLLCFKKRFEALINTLRIYDF